MAGSEQHSDQGTQDFPPSPLGQYVPGWEGAGRWRQLPSPTPPAALSPGSLHSPWNVPVLFLAGPHAPRPGTERVLRKCGSHPAPISLSVSLFILPPPHPSVPASHCLSSCVSVSTSVLCCGWSLCLRLTCQSLCLSLSCLVPSGSSMVPVPVVSCASLSPGPSPSSPASSPSLSVSVSALGPALPPSLPVTVYASPP